MLLALTFGALYPRLHGAVGSLKALCLGGLVAASTVLPLVLPGAVSVVETSFILVEVFLFSILLGVLFDWRTLRVAGVQWRYLADFYQVRRMRFAIGYLAPVAAAVAVLIVQIVAGQGTKEVVKSAPTTLSPRSPTR